MNTPTRTVFSNKSNEIPLSIEQMVQLLQSISGNALVCVSDQLCWCNSGKVAAINSTPELFARINHFADIDWRRNAVTKDEFFAGAKSYVPTYKSSSDSPHFPPMPGVLYTTPVPAKNSTGKLDELAGRFSPATDLDRVLIKAFIITLFWGGPWGKRPVFTVTSDTKGDKHKGRGSGKTTLVELCSTLVGGSMAIRTTWSQDRMMAVLLSPAARSKRVALFDNLKAFRFSSDMFESLVTCGDINGHRLNQGYASRPNDLTFAVTVNGASFSKDMAERTVVVKLKQPKKSGTWYKETLALIEQHRDEIIADVQWHLSRKNKVLKQTDDRWEVWCAEVLARLPEADQLIELLDNRRKEIDEDDQASDDYKQHVEACIQGYDASTNPDKAYLYIPSPLMLKWLRLMNPGLDSKQVSGLVTQYLSDRVTSKRTSTMRGYIWTGKSASTAMPPVNFKYEVSLNGKSNY